LWPNWTPLLVEGVSGRYYSASSRCDLLSQVAYNILAQPVYWENIIDGCKFYLGALKAPKWVVRPFGPTTRAKSLVETLKPTIGFEVTLDAAFGLITPQMSTPTKPPIAIIGMAGRFPNADNPDALWDVLEKGIDCHRVVRVSRRSCGLVLKLS
jgi:iron transport multicopper oxidase